MPRKRKILSRGSSPEKAVGSDFSFSPGSAGQYGQTHDLTIPTSDWAMAWQSPSNGGHGNSGQNHDHTFQQVQDMFEGKVDGEVVYMVLQECEWKVDEAVEKLCILTSGTETNSSPPVQHHPDILAHVDQSTNERLPSSPASQKRLESTITLPTPMHQLPLHSQIMSSMANYSNMPCVDTLDAKSDLSSRFPPVSLGPISTSTDGLPMLSPKTPAVASVEFPFPQGVPNVPGENSLKSALEALDSYANNMAAPGYQHQQSFSAHMYDFHNPEIEPSTGRSRIQDLLPPSPQTSLSYQEQSSQGLKLTPGDSAGNFTLTEGSPLTYRNPADFANVSGSASSAVGTTAFSSRSRSLSPQSVLQSQTGMQRSLESRQSSHESNAASVNEEVGIRPQIAHRQGSTSSSGTPSSANSLPSPFFAKVGQHASNFIPEHHERVSPALPTSPQLTPITGITERSLSSESQPEPQETEKRNPMQILRHQNISLDPTERENLERLIEEVIIGGIGEGALDYSDESSSEDEVTPLKSDTSDIKARVKKEIEDIKAYVTDGTPIPQSNLKVAAKHMKNLPPRFLKRLQAVNAEDGEDTDDSSPERTESPPGDKIEVHKKKDSKKKKKRELLKGLDVFMDEQGVKVLQLVSSTEEPPNGSPVEEFQVRKSPLYVSQEAPVSTGECPVPDVNVSSLTEEQPDSEQITDKKPEYLSSNSYEEARASPKVTDGASKSGTNTPKSMKSLANPNIILRQDAVNCEELEKELLKITGQARESPKPYQPRPRHPAVLSEPPKISRMTLTDKGEAKDPTPFRDESHGDKASSQFSVNAPEFVPRSFTPINVPVPSTVPEPVMMLHPPVKSRSPFHPVIGRHSPQIPVYVTNTPPGRHSPAHSPAFMVPKVPAGATAAMHSHPSVGMVPMQHHYAMQPYPYHPQYTHHAYGIPRPFIPGHPYPTWITDKPEKHLTGRGIIHPFQVGPHGVSPHLDKLHMRTQPHLTGSSRSSSAPTVVPINPKMAANLQPVTLYPMPVAKAPGETSAKVLSVHPPSHERSPLVKQASVKNPREVVDGLIKDGKKVMVILRGCPGSGKSTLARELKCDGVILSTDDFFVRGDIYDYDVSKLSDAHEWNQKRTKDAIAAGTNPIIIDNTNTAAWEMKFYVGKALENDYHVEIVEPDTAWKFKVKELAKRNTHGVPAEVIQRMVDRYEHNLTVASFMGKNDSHEHMDDEAEQNQEATGQDPEKKKKRRKRRRKRKAADANKSLDGEKSSDDETTDGTCTSREASLDVDDHPDDKVRSTSDPVLGGSIEEVEEEMVKEEGATIVSTLAGDVFQKDTAAVSDLSCDLIGASVQVLKQSHEKLQPDYIKSDSTDSDVDHLPETAVGLTDSKTKGPSIESNISGNDNSVLVSSQDEKENDLHEKSPGEKAEKQLKRSHRVPLKLQIGSMKHSQSPVQDDQEYNPDPLDHLETPDFLKADIEEFIKDKILEGLINEEVAQITGQSARYSSSGLLVKPVPVMQDSLTHTCSEKQDNKGSNSEHPSTVEEGATNLIDGHVKPLYERQISSGQSSGIEESYWTKSLDVPDPYTVKVESGQTLSAPVGCVDSAQEKHEDVSNISARENEKDQWSTPKPKRDKKRERKEIITEWDSDGSANRESISIDTASDSDSVPGTPVTPSSQSKKSPGKKRLAAKFPGPHLDSSVKEKLISTDWQLPSFDSVEMADAVQLNSVPLVSTRTTGTFTLPADFATVHKLLQGIHVPNYHEMFLHVLDTFCRDIQDQNMRTPTDQLSPSHMKKLRLDKSCSTDDLEQLLGNGRTEFLRNCFPSVSLEDLNDILSHCDGNTEWAINILLDSGYEYNEPNHGFQSPATFLNNNGVQDAIDNQNLTSVGEVEIIIQSDEETVTAPVIEKPESSSPPPLMVLCHTSLEPSHTLLSSSVQDNIVQKSVQRLESIEKFKLQRSLSQGSGGIPSLCRTSTDSVGSVDEPQLDMFDSCHVPGAAADRRLKRSISADGNQKIMTTVYTPEVEVCKDEDVILEEVTETVIVEDLENVSDVGAACSADVLEAGASDVASHALVIQENKVDEDLISQLARHYEGAGAEMGALSPDIKPLSPSGASTGMMIPKEDVQEQIGDPEVEQQMTLTLSPALARQLIDMFGPVGFHISPDSLDSDDLKVCLNRKVGRQIHRRWALTLHEKFALEEIAIKKMIQEDEALARQLQREEEVEFVKTQQRETEKNQSSLSPSKRAKPPQVVGVQTGYSQENYMTAGGSPVGNPCVVTASTVEQPASLQEIMDEELAMKRSREEFDQLNTNKNLATSLAAKLNLKKLQEMYSNIDPVVVEEIFKGSGCSMKKALELIQGTHGNAPEPKDVMTAEAAEAYEALLISRAQEESLKTQWLGSAEDEGSPDFQSMDDPDYQDFRAEGSHHYRLRHECFQKAQEAYQRGMKSVATFYSQQGHLHTVKLREANHRAAERIMEHRNAWLSVTNQVDLHGLHVDEALRALDHVISKKEIELKGRPDKRRMHLTVITGKGNHSRQGVARIRPAVIDYLSRKSYNFTEPQAGVIKLQLKYRDNI